MGCHQAKGYKALTYMVGYGINNEAAKSLNSVQLLTDNPDIKGIMAMATLKTITNPDPSQAKIKPSYYQKAVRSKKPCLECGKLYTGKTNKSKYCSSSCKYMAQKRRNLEGKTVRAKHHTSGVDRECPVCGKAYHVSQFNVDRNRKKVCSLKCRKKLNEKIYECIFCGKEIKGFKSENKKFCSHKCHGAYLRKTSEAKNKKICKQCGNDFISQLGGVVTARSGTFCSRVCRWDWERINNDAKPIACSIWYCGICGVVMREFRKYCSPECLKENDRKYQYARSSAMKSDEPIICKQCGKAFVPEYGNKKRLFCSTKCGNRYARKASGGGNFRKRARRAGVKYEYVNVMKVFDRDGWHCQICGKATPRENRGTRYSNAPELDHRVPISKHGPHTYANVQCSCRACNGWKSNHNELGQLPLFELSIG